MKSQKFCNICGLAIIEKSEPNVLFCNGCRNSDLFLMSDWLPEVEAPGKYDYGDWEDIA